MEIVMNSKRAGTLLGKLERKIERRIASQKTSWNRETIWVLIFVFLMVAFLMAGYVLRRLDPMAAILDIGVLMVLLLSLIAVFIAHVWATLATECVMIELIHVGRSRFGELFNNINTWQIISSYGASYFLFFCSFLWCFSKCL